MIRNSTSFSVDFTSKIKNLYNVYENDGTWNTLLKYYQYIVKNVITNTKFSIEDSRGLLIYFTMGLGKTRTAASIALSVDIPVIIILPKSLQKNFEDTITYLNKFELNKNKKSNIKYISLNAYNVASQLNNIDPNINNSLIIIDEAHNLFRSIISGGETSNAYKIYNQIMNAKGIKLLLLTGTPISKDPFELVPCINMLSGKDTLPIYYDQFNHLYVDMVNKKILNRDLLANRLLGLISYTTSNNTDDFPIENDTIISYVEMSEKQYRRYLQAREKEGISKKYGALMLGKQKSVKMSVPKQVSMHAYYVESRSFSNYVDPIPPDKEINIDNGPKLELITERVKDSEGLSIVYSQFVNTHGLKQLTFFLEKKGIYMYNENSDKNSNTYAYYTGNVNVRKRGNVLTIFNSNNNLHGEIIKVLLISKTGAEGIDLKNVRQTHQMEPYWDLARDKQIKSRAIRFESHINLPKSERSVTPYLYIATANKKIWNGLRVRESKTIDETFHERAVEKDIINQEFNDILKDVSIECSYFNLTDRCYVCQPNGDKLFTDDIISDMKIKNPCLKYVETERDADRITIDGIDMYYTLDPIKVYKYNISLDGYVEIPVTSKVKNMIKNNKT